MYIDSSWKKNERKKSMVLSKKTGTELVKVPLMLTIRRVVCMEGNKE